MTKLESGPHFAEIWYLPLLFFHLKRRKEMQKEKNFSENDKKLFQSAYSCLKAGGNTPQPRNIISVNLDLCYSTVTCKVLYRINPTSLNLPQCKLG